MGTWLSWSVSVTLIRSANALTHWIARACGTAALLLVLQSSVAAFGASGPAETSLSDLRSQYQRAASGAPRVRAAWQLADALAQQGLLLQAQRILQDAELQSNTDSEKRETALRLAAVWVEMGDTEGAGQQLGLVGPTESLPPAQRVLAHRVAGQLAVRGGDLIGAEKSFLAQAGDAQALGDHGEEARARINAMRARLDRQDIAEIDTRLVELDKATQSLPPGEERASLELAVGELYERAIQEFRSPVTLRGNAYGVMTRARGEATSTATRAYATGLIAGLYEDEGRAEEALQLTSEAIFLAQAANAPEQVYRWEWQAGRLQRTRGNGAASIQSLDRALFALSDIRDDVLQSSRRAFGSLIEPVYLDYADVHLRQAAALPDGSPNQERVLRDVRDQLESLKRAEVQDYFANSCAANAAGSHPVGIAGTAVIYPILLPDRLEVVIEASGTLRRFSVPVSRGEVIATVRRLRIGLERSNAPDLYLKPAQQLYQWLLGDAGSWLTQQKTDTLVFVPSGALRTIPLSALHDGSKFVIERYAVATTPAITLIPTLVTENSARVLVAGISDSVQGFAALPGVDTEIHTVGSIMSSESLENERFSLASIRVDLSEPQFAIAHLATHGQFSADHRESFVLTYDSRLTMDGLQAALAHRHAPLDLLVLSACSTAAGDDRAALGLAGVAVQSGARSALASLWSISDEATAQLMATFYKSHKEGATTKAQSLREAQLELLHSAEFRHPSYWAPYLMIGNWL
jgi:CHAT domain-containing protein